MTLLLVSKVIPARSSPDLTSVTAPFSGGDYSLLKEELKQVIQALRLKMDRPEWDSPHLTTHKSPNGQALVSSMYELGILPASLVENLRVLGGKVLQEYMEDLRGYPMGSWNKKFRVRENNLIRKLSIVNDPEGKCRIIAVLDYWTQTALKPLHDRIFRTLRKFNGDCTFNQGGWNEWLAPTGPYHSLDLQSATDRFPAELQSFILGEIVDPEYGKAWLEALTDHEFYVPWESKTVKYCVGQPMGAYSSWAVFALSHHLVVRVAAIRAGFTPDWCNYALLGDDIVIGSHEVAVKYREIMDLLGVAISEAKSHVSEDTFEFAKRWVHSGTEITGAPIKGIMQASRYYEIVSHISEIEDRWMTDDTMVSRQMLCQLFSFLYYPSLARRLAKKAYNLYLMPSSKDTPNVLQQKLVKVSREWFQGHLGCHREASPLIREIWLTWVAEAKTAVLEEGIKKSHRNLVKFNETLQGLAASWDTGSVDPRTLWNLPPCRVAKENLGNMQEQFEKLRIAFTTGGEEDIVFNKVVRLGLQPDRLFSDRDHKIVLASHASLCYYTVRLIGKYIEEKEEFKNSALFLDI